MIIGVTDEAPSLVDGWVEKYKPSYPIVCLENGKLEDFLGVEFFPTAAVISPAGTLAYAGSAGGISSPLKKAMSSAKKAPLFGKAFAKVSALMRAGDYTKGYAALLKLIEKGKLSDDDSEMAAKLREYFDGLAASALSDAKGLMEEGLVFLAVQRLEPFAQDKSAFKATADIRSLLTEWEAEPSFKEEMTGGAKMLKADELMKAGEYAKAFKAYKAVWKKFGEARIAEAAHSRATEIMQGGMAGWKSTCPSCSRNKKQRACKKHAIELKL